MSGLENNYFFNYTDQRIRFLNHICFCNSCHLIIRNCSACLIGNGYILLGIAFFYSGIRAAETGRIFIPVKCIAMAFRGQDTGI
jgi:hypothetical protein